MLKKINDTKVSILCFTYNQVKYIDDALIGFEKQTIFDTCEIIIHDDSSTDGTLEKLIAFKEKYPKKVKLITEDYNRFSRGDYKFFKECFSICNGDYIALCEGDDYWLDPNKLKLQYDYLLKHPFVNLIFHKVELEFINQNRKNEFFPVLDKNEITRNKLFKNNFIQTNSVMYRKIDYNNMQYEFLPLDWYWHIYHMGDGGMHFIDKTMSVYRINDKGIWYESHLNLKKFWKNQWKNHLQLYTAMKSLATNKTQNKYIEENEYAIVDHLIRITKDKKLLKTLIIEYCDLVVNYLNHQNKKIESLDALLNDKIDENIKLSTILNRKSIKGDFLRLYKKYTS